MVRLRELVAHVNTVAYGIGMSKRLGKQEWIGAGLKALSEQGIDLVRVEKLAAALQVTKGSFYWHFKNREALLKAVLEAWKARATSDVISKVEEIGGDARARLQSLFRIVLESDGRLDMAIRAWANKDKVAQTALADIDKRRLAYLETLFMELGMSSLEAAARARFSYHALIGQFAMGAPAIPQGLVSQQFDIIFEMLVSGDEM
jgi:AcrR family transcriptional regulator